VLCRKDYLQSNASSRRVRVEPRYVIHNRMTFLSQLAHRILESADFVGLRIISGTHSRARNFAFDGHCPASKAEARARVLGANTQKLSFAIPVSAERNTPRTPLGESEASRPYVSASARPRWCQTCEARPVRYRPVSRPETMPNPRGPLVRSDSAKFEGCLSAGVVDGLPRAAEAITCFVRRPP
jgi:hypothetical protein